MLTNQLKSSTQLTNKEFWHCEVVVANAVTNSVVISVNQNQIVMNSLVMKMPKMNKGLLYKKYYPFSQNIRKMQTALQPFSRPPKP